MRQKNTFKVTALTPQIIWTLEEVKNYMRIEADYDNALITSLIEAAIITAENFTNLSIISRMIEFTCNLQNQQTVQLKYVPITYLGKVTIKTSTGEIELQDRQYYVDHSSSVLCLNEPLEYQEIVGNYRTGFNQSNLPPAIRHGILMHVAEMYDRESLST